MSIPALFRRLTRRRPLLQRCPMRTCQALVYDLQAHFDREHGEVYR